MNIMTAPVGRTGLVMCSATGKNYQIDGDGKISHVDAADIPDLRRAGFALGDEALPELDPVTSTFVQPAPEPDTVDAVVAAPEPSADHPDAE